MVSTADIRSGTARVAPRLRAPPAAGVLWYLMPDTRARDGTEGFLDRLTHHFCSQSEKPSQRYAKAITAKPRLSATPRANN